MKRLSFYIVLFSMLVAPALSTAKWTAPTQLPDAGRHPKTEYLSIIDARKSIGYPEDLARDPDKVIRGKIPIVIIDSGFVGIKNFWKQNPDVQKNILSFMTFYEKGKKATSTHGFDVYKSAMANSPNSKYHLFQVDHSDHQSFEKALKYMIKRKLYLANYSAGLAWFVGGYEKYNPKLLKLLEKYQITLFQSAGNERGQSHFFKFSDVNQNGTMEFINPDNAAKINSKKIREYNPIKVYKGVDSEIRLFWEAAKSKDVKGKIEMQLVDKKQNILYTSKESQNNYIKINFVPEKTQPLFVKVINKGIHAPEDKSFVLYANKNIATQKYKNSMFNGFGIASLQTLKEHPFLVSVGSYGFDEDKKLVPSTFSSFSQTVDGQILPHILGPGQLVIDGEKIQGTSFSSPFITSFYAKVTGFSTKNLVESTSSHKPLSQSVKKIEASRWGVPDIMKIGRSSCFNGDKIENLMVREADDEYIYSFDLSRNCMENITYRVVANFQGVFNENGIQKIKTIRYEDGTELTATSKPLRSIDKHIVKQPMVINVAKQSITKISGGLYLKPQFHIQTVSTGKDKVKLSLKNSPSLSLLPTDKKADQQLSGDQLLEKATDYIMKGADIASLELVNRYLKEKNVTSVCQEETREVFELKTMALLRTYQYTKALEIFNAMVQCENTQTMATVYQAALYFAMGKYESVLTVVKNAAARNVFEADLEILAYCSRLWLNMEPGSIKINGAMGEKQKQKLRTVNQYLSGELDFFKFHNQLIVEKTPESMASSRALSNFLKAQQNRNNPKQFLSSVRQVIKTYFVDNPYMIIARAQLEMLKTKQSKAPPKKQQSKAQSASKITQNKLTQNKIQPIYNVTIDGKKRYISARLIILSDQSKEHLITAMEDVFLSLNGSELLNGNSYYIYNQDKDLEKQILNALKTKLSEADIKKVTLEKLVIQ